MRKIKLWIISIYNDVSYECWLWWKDFTPFFKLFICIFGILLLSSMFGVIISDISKDRVIRGQSTECNDVGSIAYTRGKEATI